ncbi:MAG TPA: polymer-forming cytoskeletal protein [Pontiella sp.]|nr:polymer-forming cytoskeletal protein [Pontiella sp.]
MLSSVIALICLLSTASHGAEFLATNAYVVAADQTVSDEIWVVANTVQTDGSFGNDLFAASGMEMSLKGTYEGNVWAAAGTTVTLDGECRRNVRITGQTLRIDGTIGGNLIAMGNTVIIGTNTTIGGNARLIGNSVVMEGTARGKVSIHSARTTTLGGRMESDVNVVSPDIFFTARARIDGNLTYTSGQELLPANGVVAGNLQRVTPETPPLMSVNRAKSHAMWFFAAFLTGVPFITLFPMTTAMASLLARKSPMKCLAVGFIASFLLPVFGLMSISSIIGLPLGALLLASWGILVYVSRIIMALMIGTMILKSGSTSIGRVLISMASGLALIYLATLVPSIGLPVQMAVVWMGMGALLLALVQKRRLIIQVPEELKHMEELRNKQNNTTEES